MHQQAQVACEPSAALETADQQPNDESAQAVNWLASTEYVSGHRGPTNPRLHHCALCVPMGGEG